MLPAPLTRKSSEAPVALPALKLQPAPWIARSGWHPSSDHRSSLRYKWRGCLFSSLFIVGVSRNGPTSPLTPLNGGCLSGHPELYVVVVFASYDPSAKTFPSNTMFHSASINSRPLALPGRQKFYKKYRLLLCYLLHIMHFCCAFSNPRHQ